MRPFLLSLVIVSLAAPYARAQSLDCSTPAAVPLPATVPIDVTNNHVYLHVCVGGRPLSFILDTGAPLSFVDIGAARNLGLSLKNESRIGGVGAGTTGSGELARPADVVVAGTEGSQRVGSAIDLSRLVSREGHAFDGILGRDFLDRYVIVVDYARNQAQLLDPKSFRYDGPGPSVPIKISGGYPYLDGALRLADGAVVKGRMTVDVGATGSLMIPKWVVDDNKLRERVGPTVRRRGGSGVGGPVRYDIGRVGALVIGNGVTLENPTLRLYGDSSGAYSAKGEYIASIGGDVLRRFILTIDYKHDRLIFEPGPDRAAAFEEDMSGMGLTVGADGASFVAEDVIDGGPAAAAGLINGDIVTAVDGQPVTRAMLDDLRKRLRRAGEKVTLTVWRGSEVKTLAVVTRRLV